MPEEFKDSKNWIRGFVGAFIGGVANCITQIIVDPVDYNTSSPEGLHKLGWTALVSGIVSAALFIKQHPVE